MKFPAGSPRSARINLPGPSCAAWVTALLWIVPSVGSAQEPEHTLDREQLKRWSNFYRQEAEQYEMFLETEPPTPLVLHQDAVFRWVDPKTSHEFNGDIFVWTADHRPQVVGAIWSSAINRAGKRVIVHSFHSLATQPLRALRKGELYWYPDAAGVEFQRFPEEVEPADSSRGQATQLRALARRFSARETMAEGRTVALRLLPQPVYAFEGPTPAEAAGGMFVLLNDWDPEALLLLETRPTAEGPKWHYAAARFCVRTVRIYLDDQEVWRYDAGGPSRSRRHRYLSVHGASLVDPLLPALDPLDKEREAP